MIKYIVNIVEFQILYNVLNEIKSNLNFEVINYKNNNDFFDSSNFKKIDIENSLILTNEDNNKITKNEKIDQNTVYIYNRYPLTIIKLIENINVRLIKLKYTSQSKVNLKNYIINLNSRIIYSNEKFLKLTEREIDIILFLNDNKKPQKIETLQKEVWGYSSDLETHTVETHVYRLRKKIKDEFNDDQLIISHEDGYFIE